MKCIGHPEDSGFKRFDSGEIAVNLEGMAGLCAIFPLVTT